MSKINNRLFACSFEMDLPSRHTGFATERTAAATGPIAANSAAQQPTGQVCKSQHSSYQGSSRRQKAIDPAPALAKTSCK